MKHDAPLRHDTPTFALQPGRCNVVRVAHIELKLDCRDIGAAATYLIDNFSVLLTRTRPDDEGTDPSSTSSLTTTPDWMGPTTVPPSLADRLYTLRERAPPSRTQIEKFLAVDPWTCDRFAFICYPSCQPQIDILERRLALLRPLPVSRPLVFESAN